jgi:Protein of unknown function (DUF1553)/Protein of unknown function (DUF1549)/Planctomycete cytochrome C
MRSRIAAAASVVLSVLGTALVLYYVHEHHTAKAKVEFSRDIRPILNQSCVSCHGGVRQKNDVSFIYREEALGKGKSGRQTIVPGHPETSELMARVTSSDPEARMPYHAPPLQPQQIALLRQWIKEGAHWEDHWAFVAPKPQALPNVKRAAWPRQPLDRFILARLEKEGISPASEADKEALLRRVSFDLTGLPPTPEEISAFLADTSADAYEKQVDRLVISPHYGERWASLWLDLARYADSRGYEKDLNRPTWPYRDWVIDAFNRNLPYDQFVITQLAGDLLPNATFEDRIATSFQRQTPVNDEGGTDDEEFRLVAVMDRVATTWSVLNGVTINCVQCHSHPYDPIRHAEYYKFLAFYNTSRDADLGDDSPTLPIPKQASRRSEIAQLEERRARLLPEIVGRGRSLVEHTQWIPLPITTGAVNEVLALERSLAQVKLDQLKGKNPGPEEISPNALQKVYVERIAQATSALNHAKRAAHLLPLKIENGEARAAGTIPEQSVFELLTESAPSTVTALRIDVPPMNPVKARHTPEDGFIVDRVDAWIIPSTGHEQKIHFRYFSPDSEEGLASALKSEDGPMGGFAANTKLFRTRWIVAIPDKPLSLSPGSRLKLQLTHTQAIASKPAAVSRVRLNTSSDARWSAWALDTQLATKLAQLADLERRLAAVPSVPLPVMVEESADEQRETLEFERGNLLTKIGPALLPDVPALFPKLPVGAPPNRLTMARWFFAPEQPLTARVAVNRYWEQLFGIGLVETLENFGSAGEAPSHPELLDWLAMHFQNDLHWDMKALLRELVTSATYRQSAKVVPALLEKDPRNRLLAHGPQQRLTAEMVRDQALLASGLLTPSIGGPPVMPPQPAGVWMTVYNDSKWTDATGPDRYRRAIYTFLKRSAIYPSFLTFDASAHDVSLARRISTNTPLQALVTLNDPVYQEAAEALARRMLIIGAKSSPPQSGRSFSDGDVLEARLDFGAERVLSRDLTPKELEALKALYEGIQNMPPAPSQVAFTSDVKTARRSVNKHLVAFTAVAGVLLNLDAALTR